MLDLNDDVHLNVCNIFQVAGSLVLDLNDDVYLNVCNIRFRLLVVYGARSK